MVKHTVLAALLIAAATACGPLPADRGLPPAGDVLAGSAHPWDLAPGDPLFQEHAAWQDAHPDAERAFEDAQARLAAGDEALTAARAWLETGNGEVPVDAAALWKLGGTTRPSSSRKALSSSSPTAMRSS